VDAKAALMHAHRNNIRRYRCLRRISRMPSATTSKGDFRQRAALVEEGSIDPLDVNATVLDRLDGVGDSPPACGRPRQDQRTGSARRISWLPRAGRIAQLRPGLLASLLTREGAL
jgi:hypothetical protein